MLQKRIGEPLATVQTLMQRDKVIWERGFLATPPVRPREHPSACPSACQAFSSKMPVSAMLASDADLLADPLPDKS